ncbi:hypothetical protein HDU93_008530, partial [Gonapodya sp. JEL0774]
MLTSSLDSVSSDRPSAAARYAARRPRLPDGTVQASNNNGDTNGRLTTNFLLTAMSDKENARFGAINVSSKLTARLKPAAGTGTGEISTSGTARDHSDIPTSTHDRTIPARTNCTAQAITVGLRRQPVTSGSAEGGVTSPSTSTVPTPRQKLTAGLRKSNPVALTSVRKALAPTSSASHGSGPVRTVTPTPTVEVPTPIDSRGVSPATLLNGIADDSSDHGLPSVRASIARRKAVREAERAKRDAEMEALALQEEAAVAELRSRLSATISVGSSRSSRALAAAGVRLPQTAGHAVPHATGPGKTSGWLSAPSILANREFSVVLNLKGDEESSQEISTAHEAGSSSQTDQQHSVSAGVTPTVSHAVSTAPSTPRVRRPPADGILPLFTPRTLAQFPFDWDLDLTTLASPLPVTSTRSKDILTSRLGRSRSASALNFSNSVPPTAPAPGSTMPSFPMATARRRAQSRDPSQNYSSINDLFSREPSPASSQRQRATASRSVGSLRPIGSNIDESPTPHVLGALSRVTMDPDLDADIERIAGMEGGGGGGWEADFVAPVVTEEELARSKSKLQSERSTTLSSQPRELDHLSRWKLPHLGDENLGPARIIRSGVVLAEGSLLLTSHSLVFTSFLLPSETFLFPLSAIVTVQSQDNPSDNSVFTFVELSDGESVQFHLRGRTEGSIKHFGGRIMAAVTASRSTT